MRVPLPAARMTAFIAHHRWNAENQAKRIQLASSGTKPSKEADKFLSPFSRRSCFFVAVSNDETILCSFRPASVLRLANARGAGKQLTGQHAPAATPALSPAEAQKKFVVPEGFEVRLFAAEPDVINPVAMTWDERGRLWVLELYEYPLGAPPGQKGRDRIKILEDTDNDGRADKVTIFADGLNLATGIWRWATAAFTSGQAPDLLFLQDTNRDDKADTRTVLLTGFGLEDRHELLNGFTWGPDGWLYMTHGVFTHSKVKIPEATTPGVEVNAAVARFHPRTKKFEVFADGTSNPWGVDFDRYGNAFVSACVIDHLFHMAPGGIYSAAGRHAGESLRLRIAAVHRGPQASHGGLLRHLHLSGRSISGGISGPRVHGQHPPERDQS